MSLRISWWAIANLREASSRSRSSRCRSVRSWEISSLWAWCKRTKRGWVKGKECRRKGDCQLRREMQVAQYAAIRDMHSKGWDSSTLQAWKRRVLSYNCICLHSPTERPVGKNVHMLLPVMCLYYCSIRFKHSAVVRKWHSHTCYCDKQSLHHSRHADITAQCQCGMELRNWCNSETSQQYP